MRHYVKFFGFGTLIVLVTIALISTFGRKALMYLVILAALFLLFIVHVNAQTKADTPKPAVTKPTFESALRTTDPVAYEVKGVFNLQQVNDYLTFESVTKAQLIKSKMPIDEFTRMETNHQLVSDSLRAEFGHQVRLWIEAKAKKFTADTTAQYHPKK